MGWDEAPTIPAAALEDSVSSVPRLIVIHGARVETFPLSRGERLVVGRGEGCRIAIDDPLISREHAAVHVGKKIELEDLGSANSTRVMGERLAPHQRVEIAPGQLIELGSTMLMLQLIGPDAIRIHLRSHAYFEARLEDECSRGEPAAVAVIRVRIDGELPPAELSSLLTQDLGSNDVIAGYAPGEFEILLSSSSRARAENAAERIRQRFASRDIDAHAVVAASPDDGRSSEALLAALAEGVRPSPSSNAPAIVEDRAMIDLFRLAERVAKGNISVLLVGETGVGKEVLAEAIHRASPRAASRFVRINCAALTESLFEAELFGHEKGAFTGAARAKAGLLESADGGTVFLDEIAELPLAQQAKLLRAIERREIQRVGAIDPLPIDVRFISATNRDLEAEVEARRFREDLYYRLNGVMLRIPPLRERNVEIPSLATRFVADVSAQLGVAPPAISARALELLAAYVWPGNVRELKNAMDRAVLLADERIEPEHLPLEKLSLAWKGAKTGPAMRPAAMPRDPEQALEAERILRALEQTAGNQKRAAELLGMPRRTLSDKLNRYGILRPRKLGDV